MAEHGSAPMPRREVSLIPSHVAVRTPLSQEQAMLHCQCSL